MQLSRTWASVLILCAVFASLVSSASMKSEMMQGDGKIGNDPRAIGMSGVFGRFEILGDKEHSVKERFRRQIDASMRFPFVVPDAGRGRPADSVMFGNVNDQRPVNRFTAIENDPNQQISDGIHAPNV